MNIEKGSMIQVAIDALKEKGSEMSFPELWTVVKETLEITPEEEMNRIGHFYADLSLSGAVIVLADNYWDLADRHDLQAKVDVTEIYSDIESASDDEADAKEEKLYDEAMMGVLREDSEDEDFSEDDGEDRERRDREDAADFVGDR